MFAGEGDQRFCYLGLVFLEVRPAPFWSCVDGDGGDLGDALTLVVADPIQRLALDLHPPWLGYAAGAVEHDYERETGIVGDGFGASPRTTWQPVIPRGGQFQRLGHGHGEHEIMGPEPQVRLARDLPTVGAGVQPDGPLAGADIEPAGEVFGDGGHAPGSPVAGMAVLVRPALGVGETARPLGGGTGLEPAVDEVGEAVAPDREKLGPMVESTAPDAPGRHPAADATTLVQDGHVPASALQRAGGEQARDAGPDDDAGFRVRAHA